MMLADVYEVPIHLSLACIAATLAAASVLSIARQDSRTRQSRPAAVHLEAQAGQAQAARKPASTGGGT